MNHQLLQLPGNLPCQGAHRLAAVAIVALYPFVKIDGITYPDPDSRAELFFALVVDPQGNHLDSASAFIVGLDSHPGRPRADLVETSLVR